MPISGRPTSSGDSAAPASAIEQRGLAEGKAALGSVIELPGPGKASAVRA